MTVTTWAVADSPLFLLIIFLRKKRSESYDSKRRICVILFRFYEFEQKGIIRDFGT